MTTTTPDLGPAARWVYGGYAAQYRWAQCKYCGRAASTNCDPVACLCCGTVQCFGNGGSNGRCKVCYHGFLPGWSRLGGEHLCGRKDCEGAAVTKAPRVGRVCLAHAATTKLRVGTRSLTIVEFAAECVAHRDSGKGWERWRYVA